jgi:hypothetical protein
MSEQVTEQRTAGGRETPVPSGRVRALDRLVGRWSVTGGATGTVEYAWMDGGFFLQQRVEPEQDGQRIRGVEIIGLPRPFMEEAREHVHSRFYDNQGNALDHVHQMDSDTYTIWAGEAGSPAFYQAASMPAAMCSPAAGCIPGAVATTWCRPASGADPGPHGRPLQEADQSTATVATEPAIAAP